MHVDMSKEDLIREISKLRSDSIIGNELFENVIQTIEKLSQREKELNALMKGSKALLQQKSFAESARAIFDHCKDLIGATSGYVALLSDDGEENDLLIIAELDHQGPAKTNTFNMYMYLTITYPSGEKIDFLWKVTVYEHQDFTFEFQIINGALESGWYTADIYILLEGFSEVSDSSQIIFDPPASTRGDQPDALVFVY